SDPQLRDEAIRVLAFRTDETSQSALAAVAANHAIDQGLRAFAVLGLAHSASSSPTKELLTKLLNEPGLECDALRSLREVRLLENEEVQIIRCCEQHGNDDSKSRERSNQMLLTLKNTGHKKTKLALDRISLYAGRRPANREEWLVALKAVGDPVAGERVFFHPRGPRCYACHRIDGRGTAIGPDLSTIGTSLGRERLIESILLPSKEIAPQFTSWQIATRDGRLRTGMIVEEGPNSTVTIA